MNSRGQDRREQLRRTLKAAGVAAVGQYALPDHWLRPVVKSVLLPAHAQTTATEDVVDPAPFFRFTFSGCSMSTRPITSPLIALDIAYTPIDTSGALTGQVVATRYTVRDTNDTIVITNLLPNTVFGTQADPAPAVNPNSNPGPWTVTIEFEDEVTFGSFQCTAVANT